jgi:hypothetical protein
MSLGQQQIAKRIAEVWTVKKDNDYRRKLFAGDIVRLDYLSLIDARMLAT